MMTLMFVVDTQAFCVGPCEYTCQIWSS